MLEIGGDKARRFSLPNVCQLCYACSVSEMRGATMKRGSKVLVHGKRVGRVLSVHAGGKRLGIVFPNGDATFVSAAAVKAAT